VNGVAKASSRERATDGSTGSSKLADLYERSGPGSIRLAYLLTGDRGVAEDIAQDAFVRVVGHLGHLRDASSFDAYLRRTVVNLSKNHFRRRAVERRFLARAAEPEPVPGPEGASIDRHTIVHALGRLPQRQRAAIVLRYYEDLPEDTIASVLRCRPATVRSLVARGVQTLRSDLREAIDA
jgi:RNA polymerase sigma-70 factor (sigma-E family)